MRRASSVKGSRASVLLPGLRLGSMGENRLTSPPLQVASSRTQKRNSGILDVVERKSEEDDIPVTASERIEFHELRGASRDTASMLDREQFEKALDHLNK